MLKQAQPTIQEVVMYMLVHHNYASSQKAHLGEIMGYGPSDA
jgi:hypothetical protein